MRGDWGRTILRSGRGRDGKGECPYVTSSLWASANRPSVADRATRTSSHAPRSRLRRVYLTTCSRTTYSGGISTWVNFVYIPENYSASVKYTSKCYKDLDLFFKALFTRALELVCSQHFFFISPPRYTLFLVHYTLYGVY